MQPPKKITTKHGMFEAKKCYASQENITQPLVVMVETFRRSGCRYLFWPRLACAPALSSLFPLAHRAAGGAPPLSSRRSP